MRIQRTGPFLATFTMILALLLAAFPAAVAAQGGAIQPLDPGAAGAPVELVVDGQRYLRDLDVPADLNPMEQRAAESGETVYAKPGASDPLGAVYLPLDDGSGASTRYYPELLGQADATCPAERADTGTLTGNGASYVSAGPELDFTPDALQELGTTNDGAAIYGIPGDDQMRTIFVAQNSGQGPNSLVRYVLQEADGVPAGLPDPMTFGGQAFAPAPGAVTGLDGLVRVGCAGLFPAFAASPDQAFDVIALDVAGTTVAFQATEGGAPEDVSTPPSTPESTPVPTLEATAEPTTEPTEEPTAEPTQEPTAEPTAEPTQEPTAEPTTEPTQEPTVAPTEEPTAEPTQEPTAEPTQEPTAEPTQMPTVEPTVAPDAGLGEEPSALPTEVPPTPEPGQPTPTPVPPRPTPTPRPLQPQAVVPTLAPDVPSPAAGQSDVIACAGVIGELDDNGVPERLPRNLQYGGEAYRYTGKIAFADAGEVTATGCVGAFVLYLPTDAGDTRIYLGLMNDDAQLFAFERSASLTVGTQSQADQQPRSLNLEARDDAPAVRYRATDPWQASLYSSLSLEIYVPDPEAGLPDRFYGYSVGNDVFGEYVREGDAEAASQEVIDRAEALGVHATVTLDGQRYVLVALWTPFGTTTNGWLTLYGVDGEASPSRLLGLDPRRHDLAVFDAER